MIDRRRTGEALLDQLRELAANTDLRIGQILVNGVLASGRRDVEKFLFQVENDELRRLIRAPFDGKDFSGPCMGNGPVAKQADETPGNADLQERTGYRAFDLRRELAEAAARIAAARRMLEVHE